MGSWYVLHSMILRPLLLPLVGNLLGTVVQLRHMLRVSPTHRSVGDESSRLLSTRETAVNTVASTKGVSRRVTFADACQSYGTSSMGVGSSSSLNSSSSGVGFSNASVASSSSVGSSNTSANSSCMISSSSSARENASANLCSVEIARGSWLHKLAVLPHICTWNTRALCDQAPWRASGKQKQLRRLCEKARVLLLQETHHRDFPVEAYFPKGFTVINSPHPGDHLQGGVCVAFRNKWLRENDITFHSIDLLPGRVLLVAMQIRDVTVLLVNVHLVVDRYHNVDAFSMIRMLHTRVDFSVFDLIVCGGDFNFSIDQDIQTSVNVPFNWHHHRAYSTWRECFPSFCSFAPVAPTRMSGSDASAIDHFFVNCPVEALASSSLAIDVDTVGHQVSDHFPLHLSQRSTTSFHGKISARWCRHPGWKEEAEMQFQSMWQGIRDYKRKIDVVPLVMRRITRNLDLCSSTLAPHDRQLNLHYALRLRLLWASGQNERLAHALTRVPHWKLPDPTSPNFGSEFFDLLSNLRHEAALEHLDEIRDCEHVCEEAKGSTKAKWLSILSTWKRAQVPSQILLMQDESGGATTDAGKIVDAVHKYWGGIFGKEAQIQKRDWGPMAAYIPEFQWPAPPSYTVEDVMNFMMTSKRTSPGPDGVHYAHLKASAHLVAPVLHEAWTHWVSAATVMDAHVHSEVVLLPKLLDKPVLPHQIRPIALSNTMAKILELMLLSWMSPVIASNMHYAQRGFIRGRQILDNIVDLEAK
eukprot:6492087-Amphidinium_carterae.1